MNFHSLSFAVGVAGVTIVVATGFICANFSFIYSHQNYWWLSKRWRRQNMSNTRKQGCIVMSTTGIRWTRCQNELVFPY